jgi:replicative DNA helicase
MSADNVSILKIPPHSIEAERSVIGSVMINPSCLHDLQLHPDHFYRAEHRTIWEVIQTMGIAGKAIDIVTIGDELGDSLESVGGLKYLGELYDAVPTAANVREYALAVKERAVYREGIKLGHEIAEAGFNSDKKQLGALLTEASMRATGDEARDLWDTQTSLKMALERIDRVHQGTEPPGLRFGIEALDGQWVMRPGHLVVIGARPSMGKTAVMLNIAERQRCPVGIISLEMSHEELTNRRLVMEAKVPYDRMEQANLSGPEWARLGESAKAISKRHIHIFDRGGSNINEIVRVARQLRQRENIGILFLDYLQLIEGEGNTRAEEVGGISRKLKALAKRLHIPIVVLAQLNRKCEERPNKRPMLSDLRESGQIEQDGDLIMFLYRDAMYNDVPDNEMEFLVEKCRNGPVAHKRGSWDASLMMLR